MIWGLVCCLRQKQSATTDELSLFTVVSFRQAVSDTTKTNTNLIPARREQTKHQTRQGQQRHISFTFESEWLKSNDIVPNFIVPEIRFL